MKHTFPAVIAVIMLVSTGCSSRAYGQSDAAETRIRGEVADAATGRALLRFTQRRRAGLGVGYGELLRRTVRDIGSDVARILNAF
jgi:hypothetical protein